MDRRSSWIVTVVALLAGSALVPRLTSRPANATQVSSVPAQQKAPAASAPKAADEAEHFVELVAELLNVDVSDRGRAFQTLAEAAPRYFDRVQFLVASLPDPVDSFAGWQFDPTLAAIEEAVAASGYVLDRFWFPT